MSAEPTPAPDGGGAPTVDRLVDSPLNRLRRLDHGIGFMLALLYGAMLFGTVREVGVPRDESFYFYAADRAADWVGGLFDPQVHSFSNTEIDHGFGYNHEHPVLVKTLAGVSHRLLHDRWHLVADHRAAYRVPTMVMAALAVWLTYLLGVMVQGRLAGLVAASALAFMPRYFFHTHLLCFDAPVTFTWLLGAYTYLRAARSRAWALACGVAVGLGFATKLNTFFLPFTLGAVALVDLWAYKRRHGRWTAPPGERGPGTFYAWIAASILVLGTAVFFAHWPWLWHDTFHRLRDYIAFHAGHVMYPIDYLGELYFKPPYPVHFPFVMSLVTWPVGTLVLGSIGVALLARRAWRSWRHPPLDVDRHAAELTILANIAVPMLLLATGHTPIFGGTKHWFPALPFFGIAAGVGVERLARGLFPHLAAPRRALAGAAVALAMLAPAAWATLAYHPYGITYYNELAGGAEGGARLGMLRDFWGYASIGVLPYLNEHVEKEGLVFWHDATQGSYEAYQRDGLLRPDVRYSGDWTAAYSNWGVYHEQRSKTPEELDLWRAYGTDWPVDGLFIDGVQVVAVYHRSAPPKPPPVPPGAR
jgi:4-amino-4-deoxy-L-arabinose transferase-like glycosyltransferase